MDYNCFVTESLSDENQTLSKSCFIRETILFYAHIKGCCYTDRRLHYRLQSASKGQKSYLNPQEKALAHITLF